MPFSKIPSFRGSALRRALFSLGLAALGVGDSFGPGGFEAPAAARAEKQLEALVFVTASGEHPFKVEVADTDAERERGLMQRRSMPADHGMLFDFKMEEPLAMWMKNTYIPLDMVFVTRGGLVTNIAADAKPMSQEIIPSGGPVYAVIELNAGSARRIGLAPGDRVRHRLFLP